MTGDLKSMAGEGQGRGLVANAMASEKKGERVAFNAQQLASLASKYITVDLVSEFCRQFTE